MLFEPKEKGRMPEKHNVVLICSSVAPAWNTSNAPPR